MPLYLFKNGPMQTTSQFAGVTTGTSIKTLLQLKPGATTAFRVVEANISFDGSSPATPITVEFIETDVAATVTAFVANDIDKFDAMALLFGDPTTALIAVGTTSSGYTSTSEGSITAVRNLCAPQLISPTNQFVYQLPLGRDSVIQNGKFGRIRVKAGAAVNAICSVLVEV